MSTGAIFTPWPIAIRLLFVSSYFFFFKTIVPKNRLPLECDMKVHF